jgi:hypothetical protein
MELSPKGQARGPAPTKQRLHNSFAGADCVCPTSSFMALRPVVSIVVNDLKDFKIIKESERKRAFGHPQNYIFATQQA